MKKKNITIIICIIILIGLVLLGSGIYASINKKDSIKKQSIESQEEMKSQDMIDKKYDRKRNKSEAMKEKHCLDKICITDIENTFESGSIGVISGNMINEGDSSIPAGYLKLSFTAENFEEKLIIYHAELPARKQIPLEIQHKNEKIVEATNVKIENPTPEEIKEADIKIET